MESVAYRGEKFMRIFIDEQPGELKAMSESLRQELTLIHESRKRKLEEREAKIKEKLEQQKKREDAEKNKRKSKRLRKKAILTQSSHKWTLSSQTSKLNLQKKTGLSLFCRNSLKRSH